MVYPFSEELKKYEVTDGLTLHHLSIETTTVNDETVRKVAELLGLSINETIGFALITDNQAHDNNIMLVQVIRSGIKDSD